MPCSGCDANAKPPGVKLTEKGPDRTAEVTLPVGEYSKSTVDEMLVERGFDPAAWTVEFLTVNQWDAIAGGVSEEHPEGYLVTLKQTKATLKPLVALEESEAGRLLMWALKSRAPVVRTPTPRVDAGLDGESRLIVAIGDDQAPFVNWPLHELTCEALRDLDPYGMVYMGDGADFPTVRATLRRRTSTTVSRFRNASTRSIGSSLSASKQPSSARVIGCNT